MSVEVEGKQMEDAMFAARIAWKTLYSTTVATLLMLVMLLLMALYAANSSAYDSELWVPLAADDFTNRSPLAADDFTNRKGKNV